MDLNLPGSGKTVEQTFSVFDYDTGKYRYYVAPVSAPPLTGHYRAPRGRTPEALAEKIPPHAKLAGEGDTPKGVVASLGGVEEEKASSGHGKLVLVGALALVAFALIKGRK